MNKQFYCWRSILLRMFLLFALVIAAVLFFGVGGSSGSRAERPGRGSAASSLESGFERF